MESSHRELIDVLENIAEKFNPNDINSIYNYIAENIEDQKLGKFFLQTNEGNFNIKKYFVDGVLNLSEIGYIVTEDKRGIAGSADAQKWIILPDEEKYLVKKINQNDINEKNTELDNEILKYNYAIIPEIIEQTGFETTKYFSTKMENENVVLTHSFLNDQDVIIPADKFVEECGNIDRIQYVDEQLKSLDKYLRKKYEIQDTEKYKFEYLKRIFLEKFLCVLDFHTGNWGVIEDGKTHEFKKMTPVFDFTDSCINNEAETVNILEDGNNTLESFMKQYNNYSEMKSFIKNLENKINIDKAIENVEYQNNTKVPENIKLFYSKFIEARKKEVKRIFNEIYINKEDDER